jgi:hypothetical protein
MLLKRKSCERNTECTKKRARFNAYNSHVNNYGILYLQVLVYISPR